MPPSYWADIDEEVIDITKHWKISADGFFKELTLSRSALESPSKVAKTVVLYLKQRCVGSTTEYRVCLICVVFQELEVAKLPKIRMKPIIGQFWIILFQTSCEFCIGPNGLVHPYC